MVFERNPDVGVTPASTMKLLTATAVLDQLPVGERLRTPVLTAAPVTDGVVDGDLVPRGRRRPVLGTVDWAAHFDRQPRLLTPIETLADRIVAAGVREIRGRVVGDDGRYDRERYVPTWPARYHDDNETGPLSALTVNDGFAEWDGPDPEDIPWDDPPRDAAAVLTDAARGRVASWSPASRSRARCRRARRELAAVESPTIGELVVGDAPGQRQRDGRAAPEGARAPSRRRRDERRGRWRRRLGAGRARPADGRRDASTTAPASITATTSRAACSRRSSSTPILAGRSPRPSRRGADGDAVQALPRHAGGGAPARQDRVDHRCRRAGRLREMRRRVA